MTRSPTSSTLPFVCCSLLPRCCSDQSTVFIKFVSPLQPGAILRVQFAAADGAAGAATAAVGAAAGEAFSAVLQHPDHAAGSTSSSAAAPSSAAVVTGWYDIQLKGFDASDYISERAFVPSFDGKVKVRQRIPVHPCAMQPSARNTRCVISTLAHTDSAACRLSDQCMHDCMTAAADLHCAQEGRTWRHRLRVDGAQADAPVRLRRV